MTNTFSSKTQVSLCTDQFTLDKGGFIPPYTTFRPPQNKEEVDLLSNANRAIITDLPRILRTTFLTGRIEGSLFKSHYFDIALANTDYGMFSELQIGQWVLRETKYQGDDLIELLAFLWDVKYLKALRMLVEHLENNKKSGNKLSGWTQEKAPLRSFFKYENSLDIVTYLSANDAPFAIARRYYDEAGKAFIVYSIILRNNKTYQSEITQSDMLPPYPLYNLSQIYDNCQSKIVIVSDEFKANSCFEKGCVFSAVPGGIENLLEAELSPLENRIVIIKFSVQNLSLGFLIEEKLREANVKDMFFSVNDGRSYPFSSLESEAKKYSCELQPPKKTNIPLDDLVVYGIQDFMKVPTNEFGWIVDSFIPKQGLAMVYAPRGVGKTFFALSVALACATGTSFLKWQVEKARAVLYLDAEMAASIMKKRINRICKGGIQATNGNFKILTPDCQKRTMPDLSTQKGQEAIAPHLKGISLLVVDNVSTFCRSGNENTGESWNNFQNWLLELRRRGISVLLVHHSGKSGAQRGTSKREDILDTVISLKRPSTYSSEEGARFEVHFEKHRHVSGEAAKPFEASLISEGETSTWVVQKLEDDFLDEACELFEQGLSIRAVGVKLGISKSAAGRLRSKLVDSGLLSEASKALD